MGRKHILFIAIIVFLLSSCQFKDTHKFITISPELTSSPKITIDNNPVKSISNTPPPKKIIPTHTLNMFKRLHYSLFMINSQQRTNRTLMIIISKRLQSLNFLVVVGQMT